MGIRVINWLPANRREKAARKRLACEWITDDRRGPLEPEKILVVPVIGDSWLAKMEARWIHKDQEVKS